MNKNCMEAIEENKDICITLKEPSTFQKLRWIKKVLAFIGKNSRKTKINYLFHALQSEIYEARKWAIRNENKTDVAAYNKLLDEFKKLTIKEESRKLHTKTN